jgi:hypothetical protein
VTTAGSSDDARQPARSSGAERVHATQTVDRCGVELRQAREETRRATEAVRRALRAVGEAEDAFHQATQRLERVDELRVTSR